MKTLAQILIDVNSTLDLEAASPTGDELTTRSNYANQAVWEASGAGHLSEFRMELMGLATCATIPLPANYREAHENPMLWNNGAWREYPLIEAEEKYSYLSTDYFSYILGNPSSGYNLILNNYISGATYSFIYQRYPSGLLTLTDKCELSDPLFVNRKVESYVLYSRSDDRFTIAEQRAQQTLANMMGREMKGTTSGARSTKMLFDNPLS